MMGKISPKVLESRIRLAVRGPTNMTAQAVIKEALKHDVYVAWSGGRCSTVALHITLKQAPNIPVAFNNTGIEYPETVKYVREMADKWDINFHELKPENDFWSLVKKYGFPQLRGSGKKKRPRKPMCCKVLKDDPDKKFCKENGLDGKITGIRVEENRARALTIFQKGQFYYAKKDSMYKFHPVSLWPLDELMNYVKKENIELNPLYYEGYERIGCMPCTGFISWREQLAKHRPKFFNWLNREYQKSKGEPTLWEYRDIFDICESDS